MNWTEFQQGAYDLTQRDIDRLGRMVLADYTAAKKAIEGQLKDQYLKILSGVKPADYYNEMIKYDRLKNLLTRVTAEYNTHSLAAGVKVAQAGKVGMSNNYYRKMYATEWLAPEIVPGVLPRNLVDLTVYGTADSWKKIKKRQKEIYGDMTNYAPKAGTLSSFLVGNRRAELDKIRRSITQSFIQGESYSQAAKGVADIIGVQGIKEGVLTATGAKANALRIIRTEGNRTMNAGSFAASKAAKSQGVELERQILSTLDDRVRAQSAGMDGQRRGVDEPFTYPGGVEAMYPGSTGVPRFDINDRESVIDIVDGEDPKLRRGRNPETGENEVFAYKGFDDWAADNGITHNRYGEMIAKPTAPKKQRARKAAKPDTTRGGFVPAKSVEEVKDRLSAFTRPSGYDLSRIRGVIEGVNIPKTIPVPSLNSMLQGFEEVLDFKKFPSGSESGVNKVMGFGVNPSTGALGEYRASTAGWRDYDDLRIMRDYLKDNTALLERSRARFLERRASALKVAIENDDVAREMALEVTVRNNVSIFAEDPVYATAVHEAFHKVFYSLDIEPIWKVKAGQLSKLDQLAVSEYAASDPGELFAEIGGALASGMDIPDKARDLFIETLTEVGYKF